MRILLLSNRSALKRTKSFTAEYSVVLGESLALGVCVNVCVFFAHDAFERMHHARGEV